MADIMFALLFGAVSLLYATVGQAGGTAFLALMAFASFPSNEMRPTALLLNIVAATFSTWLFNRRNLVDWAKLRPLLLASLPAALVGGFIALDERLYKTVTGMVLLLAATIVALPRTEESEPHLLAPLCGAISTGAVVGFVSGLTGSAAVYFSRRYSSPCTGRPRGRRSRFQHHSYWQTRSSGLPVPSSRDRTSLLIHGCSRLPS
jgi:uncharacterized membrane protein YfcA